MKLFKFENWNLEIEPLAWSLEPFKVLLKRDKTKGKEVCFKEMAFIYFYTDIKSDYMYITNPKERAESIINDMKLPEGWKIDDKIKDAIEFYKERSSTVSERLYQSALRSATDISEYLDNTRKLLAERDDKGKPVFTINTITASLKMIPDIMKNLDTSYKQLLKEKEDTEGRKKGSQTMGMFEDGI